MNKLITSAGVLTLAYCAMAQSSLVTGFEAPTWSLGSANQNGWSNYGNSPVRGVITNAQARSGSQSLELRTLDTQAEMDVFSGVINGYHTSLINPVGETGTSASNGAATGNRFLANFWYRTPDSAPTITNNYGGFVQMNPAFDTNRYGWVGVIDGAQDTTGFYTAADGLVVELDTPLNKTDLNQWDYSPVAKNLSYGAWYRFEYDITLVDGLAGNGPNDIFKVSVFNAGNSLLGSYTNSTWEAGFAAGQWGGSGPFALNGMDFQKLTNAPNQSLGYVDDFSIAAVPEPGTMLALGLGAAGLLRRKRAK